MKDLTETNQFLQSNVRPKTGESAMEEGGDIDINEIIRNTEYGQKPSAIANLKKANLTVDKLTAEVRQLRCLFQLKLT